MDSSTATSFAADQYFPARRRVWQACTNCRARKTRCDAAKPKCSLCAAQNVECVYKDSQQPRIENNTKILLERIQMLEDRIFSSPVFSEPSATEPASERVQSRCTLGVPTNASIQQITTATTPSPSGPAVFQQSPQQTRTVEQPNEPGEHQGDVEIPIPLSHTANANHVLTWPIVQELLSQSTQIPSPKTPKHDIQFTGATDVFFQSSSIHPQDPFPPESWRLTEGIEGFSDGENHLHLFDNALHAYFARVDVFYPILSQAVIRRHLGLITASEGSAGPSQISLSPARYALVLLVISFGLFIESDECSITLRERHDKPVNYRLLEDLSVQLWRKAKLLLGHISSDMTVEAAQCSLLASLYQGARGRIAESFHWAHAAAVKCETLAKRVALGNDEPEIRTEWFRRLYWLSLICEGDFVSEVSATLPSGITRYEEMIPYPVREQHPEQRPGSEDHEMDETFEPMEELVAFQISTNAAIRRFLNRVNSVVYDSKDQFRLTRANYANWLIRITEDLWSYHAAIYQNVPDFLLKSRSLQTPTGSSSSPQGVSLQQTLGELGNDPWNVLRLRGRYFAGQYIIHRPFVEYVLLNNEHFDTHPCREVIMERCRMCLQGCMGFIDVFDNDPVNSVTCLFASGMVTFTMVILLRIATVFETFRDVVHPEIIERAIATGKRNLERFSMSAREFEWHLQVLAELDRACQERLHVPRRTE